VNSIFTLPLLVAVGFGFYWLWLAVGGGWGIGQPYLGHANFRKLRLFAWLSAIGWGVALVVGEPSPDLLLPYNVIAWRCLYGGFFLGHLHFVLLPASRWDRNT
jgi:hypothetical protein